MSQQTVKIKSVEHVTHDVLQIVTNKPESFKFEPGQATEVCINKSSCKDEKSPFTLTSLPGDNFLEFTIKTYPEREGLTNELLELKAGDELIINDAFGAISYQGEGVFIAGGAGVTPFVSIFRQLKHDNKIGNNKLLFANKTKEDVIYAKELETLLGDNFISIVANENDAPHAPHEITERFLRNHVNSNTRHVYLCGPPPMVESVKLQLTNLGVNNKSLVLEENAEA